MLGRFARGSTAAPGGSGLGLALVAQQAALHGGSIELSDSPLGGLRATLTVSTPAARGRDASAASAARQPSSSTAVTAEATITKANGDATGVGLAQQHSDHDRARHTATPVGTIASGPAPPSAQSQPTAVPAKNGHAVSATPETVTPSAWLRRPTAQNTSTHTHRPPPPTTLASPRHRRIGHHVEDQWA